MPWQRVISLRWCKYEPVETLIHEHQQEYYAALNRSTENSDSATLVEFMLQMILDATPRAQSKAHSRAQSGSILHALAPAPLSANELIAHLNLRSKTGAFKRAIKELLDDGLIEYTLPEKPNSRLQKYRLTGKGQAMPNADVAQV